MGMADKLLSQETIRVPQIPRSAVLVDAECAAECAALPTRPTVPCQCGCPLFWRTIYAPDWICLNCRPYPLRSVMKELYQVPEPGQEPAHQDLEDRDVTVFDYHVPTGDCTLLTKRVGRFEESIAWLTCSWFTRRPDEGRLRAAKEPEGVPHE